MDKNQAPAVSAASPPYGNGGANPNLPESPSIDLPPSYTEAMGHPIVQSAGSQPSAYPSAPPLDGNVRNPYPLYNPYHVQSQMPHSMTQHAYTQNDGQFSAWDERATQILMTQRLEMEERFRQARSRREQDLLWDLILLDLHTSGYHDFLIVDLIRFWEFQYHIYKGIIDGLSSGIHTDTNWQYFQPMDNVYKGSTDILSPTSTVGSSILDHDHDVVPHVPVNPLIMPSSTSTTQTIPGGPTATAVLNDTNNGTMTAAQVSDPVGLPTAAVSETNNVTSTGPPVPESVGLPTSAVGGGDNSILTTSPIAETNGTVVDSASMLMPHDSVITAATSSPSDNVVGGLMDLGSVQAALPSEPTGSSFLNNVTSESVITTQPDSLSKLLVGDGDVVTTQPFSIGLPSPDNPLDVNDGHDGCCVSDGCCGDDGCCDGDGGCCGDCDCGDCDCGDCDCGDCDCGDC